MSDETEAKPEAMPPDPKNSIIHLTIDSAEVLYKSYISFVKNGGLFVPTDKPYKLGDEVFIVLKLFDDPDKLPIAGKVIWITPTCAQGGKIAGIGVQFFDDKASEICDKIETFIASISKDDPTETM